MATPRPRRGRHRRASPADHRAPARRAVRRPTHRSPGQAQSHAEQALALYREIGNRHGEAQSLDTLGFAHQQLGDHQTAVSCYTDAAALCRAAGDTGAARTAWQQAADILTRLDHPDAERLRAKLT